MADTARDRGALVALATQSDAEDVGGARPSGSESALGMEAGADGLFDRGTAQLPALDAIVLVVATKPLAALHELSLECWSDSVAEPLRRVFWLARRAVEAFLADGRAGRLVIVVEPVPGGGQTNDVVETALRSFSSSFAREYGRRSLACNVVLPTGSSTAASAVRDPVPAVIEQALFLASPAASFVNGEGVVVQWATGMPDLGATA